MDYSLPTFMLECNGYIEDKENGGLRSTCVKGFIFKYNEQAKCLEGSM